MALPTLDATFASSVDLPRKQMLAKWLVEELGETQAPSSVLVSGAGAAAVNGIYTLTGEESGRSYYNLSGYINPDHGAISWNGNNWYIWGLSLETQYGSTDDVEFPWQVTTWTGEDGGPPMPTVTEIPSQNPIANYYDLPERYLWAKIAVAAGAPREEAAYISLPKNYAWSDIYNAVAGSSGNHTDWSENVALGHIAAAYRGDTGNPANLATYISWPWRYKVASIITSLLTTPEPEGFNAMIVSGAGNLGAFLNGTYLEDGVANGKPKYTNISLPSAQIYWNNNQWEIEDLALAYYFSANNVPTPDLVTSWTALAANYQPVPTVTGTNV